MCIRDRVLSGAALGCWLCAGASGGAVGGGPVVGGAASTTSSCDAGSELWTLTVEALSLIHI
eukprot:6295518-Alexandrium_andersonii.AAC.1